MPVIMGTAGHIDHGKTTLVKTLTGIDCDRLEEEKRRGITIELGFAYIDLAIGKRLSIVDVPGHERFIKNMVSGASGIDFVMLVIAADESVMPQTREHLEICSLLGIKSGLVALTKIDMVEPGWMELVIEDVRTILTGTFLNSAPIVPVSSRTGAGLDILMAQLLHLASTFNQQPRPDLFRLPIDRIFTMKGHGTVATGTLIAGQANIGDDMLLYPRGVATKIRGIQSHGNTVKTAPAGQRIAVNLQGLEVANIIRGEVLARPGTLFPHQIWDVELSCLSSSPRPLKNRTEVHFHHSATEVLARLYFLDRNQLAPGETALTQVRFAEPMVGVYNDRCVIRSFSPLRTVAGGIVLNPMGRKIHLRSTDIDRLTSLAENNSPNIIEHCLAMARPAGLSFAQIQVLTNLESKQLEHTLNDLSTRQRLYCYDQENLIYTGETTVAELIKKALAFLTEFHKREPIKLGLARDELAAVWGRGLPPKLAHFCIEHMLKLRQLTAEQERLKLPEHTVSLASDQTSLHQQLLATYEQGWLTPPNYKDVLKGLNINPKETASVYKLLQDQGLLVKVNEDIYLVKGALEELKRTIMDFFAVNEEMGPVEFKGLTGLSRKFAIPLLEFFDKQKLTVRVGNKRRLRRK
ncbi:Selenocysteine-specific elongation factor [Desulfovibrionales bacterium]